MTEFDRLMQEARDPRGAFTSRCLVGVLASLFVSGGTALAQPRPDGGRPGTDGGSFCIIDGGPGGCCTNDSDCLGCGWVCSWARGGYCIPSMEGDPGHCVQDADCACSGQTCASNDHCTPAANPECACNSDCPSGQICDQLSFTCKPQPSSCTLLFGSCGCGFFCNAKPGTCVAQGSYIPPECLGDLDCNVCETGSICVFNPHSPIGQFTCVLPGDGGWCHHSLGGGTTGGAPTGGGSSGGTTGSSVGTDGGASGPGAGGCGCRSAGPSGVASAALGLLAIAWLKRRRRCSRA